MPATRATIPFAVFLVCVGAAYAAHQHGVSLLQSTFRASPWPKSVHVPFPCAEEGAARECYEDFYRDVVQNDGVATAINDLKGRYRRNEMSSLDCHYVLHAIAAAQWEKTPTLAESFTYGDGMCIGGYYHGIVIAAFDEGGSPQLDGLERVCEQLLSQGKGPYDMGKCAHGVGHVAMRATGYDFQRSVEFCERMPHAYMVDDCIPAILMEYVTEGEKRKDDVLFPCNTLAPKYWKACFSLHSIHLLNLVEWKPHKALALCDAAANDVMRQWCYRGVGKAASTARTFAQMQSPNPTCGAASTPEQYKWCSMGTLESLIYYAMEPSPIRSFCQHLPERMYRDCVAEGEFIYTEGFEGREGPADVSPIRWYD